MDSCLDPAASLLPEALGVPGASLAPPCPGDKIQAPGIRSVSAMAPPPVLTSAASSGGTASLGVPPDIHSPSYPRPQSYPFPKSRATWEEFQATPAPKAPPSPPPTAPRVWSIRLYSFNSPRPRAPYYLPLHPQLLAAGSTQRQGQTSFSLLSPHIVHTHPLAQDSRSSTPGVESTFQR